MLQALCLIRIQIFHTPVTPKGPFLHMALISPSIFSGVTMISHTGLGNRDYIHPVPNAVFILHISCSYKIFSHSWHMKLDYLL